MYEDTPQELVHDLFSEAVFGRHALGRPVIGTARRDLVRDEARALDVPPADVRGRQRRHRRRRQRRAQQADAHAAAGAEPAAAAGRRTTRPATAREGAAARPSLRQEGHGAVPRVRRCAGNRALRPAPLRGLDPRLDPRRLGVVAAVPGDPREARDGVLRLLVRVPVHGHRSRRRSTSARARRTSRPALEIAGEQLADIAAGNLRPDEIARAKENLKGRIMLSMESTSNRMSRLGQVARHRHRAAVVRADHRGDRGGRARGGLRARRVCCSRPSGCRSRGSGRASGSSARRCGGSIRPCSRALREARPQRPRRQGRARARTGARSSRDTSSSSWTPPRRWSTSPFRMRSKRTWPRGARTRHCPA